MRTVQDLARAYERDMSSWWQLSRRARLRAKVHALQTMENRTDRRGTRRHNPALDLPDPLEVTDASDP